VVAGEAASDEQLDQRLYETRRSSQLADLGLEPPRERSDAA